MQSQYGKDVLGAVRLQEAKQHKEQATMLSQSLANMDVAEKRQLKEQIRSEKQQYSQIKLLRWTLLTNGAYLGEETAEHLSSILDAHSDLVICYAMKEELARLFTLRNPIEEESAWWSWFQAAKESKSLFIIFCKAANFCDRINHRRGRPCHGRKVSD